MFSVRRLFGSLLGGSAALLMIVGQAGAVAIDPSLLEAALQGVDRGAQAAADRVEESDEPIVVDRGLARAMSVLTELARTTGTSGQLTARAVVERVQSGELKELDRGASTLVQAFDDIQARGQEIAAEHRPDDPSADAPGQTKEPGEPANPPGKPDDPGAPEDPGRPEDRGGPDDPGQPGDPGRPVDPGGPEDPGQPGKPEDAGRPQDPGHSTGDEESPAATRPTVTTPTPPNRPENTAN